MDKIYKEMVENGVMTKDEVPFDESENEAPDTEPKVTLPHTLTLIDEIEYGKAKITEVTFVRVPSALVCLHLPISGNQSFGHYVPIVADSCEVSFNLIKRLSFRDYRRCIEVVTDFLYVDDQEGSKK